MTTVDMAVRVTLKNILYLTDFSATSEGALPFATAIARKHGAKVHLLHVMMPVMLAYATPESAAAMIEAEQEEARIEIRRLEPRLADLPHDATVERGVEIWPSVEQAIDDHGIDLIVMATHGRTGAKKFFLGSVAEEIFRRSRIPVLTIGPRVFKNTEKEAGFHRILFAMDFSYESMIAAPHALSLAQENRASLTVLHVIPEHSRNEETEAAAAHAMSSMRRLFPPGPKLPHPPETVVCYGKPGEKIVEVAEQHDADLIILGVRDVGGAIGRATHLERAIAHNVVVQARCPVLTVRG